ncbi:MAG: deoxyribose-phosphate aldolase [Oscillospiraceae bacterium]
MNYDNIANYIDHSVLVPQSTTADVIRACEDAKKYGFKAICVNSGNVATVTEHLKGSDVIVCSTVGFPLGAVSTDVKVYETKEAIANGATEIDMVINVGRLKDKNYEYVETDIAEIAKACQAGHAKLKVIMETCLLNDEEKVKVCELAVAAGADFVKTSTGFSSGGATEHDVQLLRKTVGEGIGVKASALITTYEIGVAMLKAGANRLGSKDGTIVMKK